jgi:hypothetical protein
MSEVALLLGPIAFQAFEIPSSINIGGAQRLAVHQLPGGIRVIDSLGRDDSDIVFSGTFSGADATMRARLIDEMRASGLPMPLTWDMFFYSVIIKDFRADYRSSWWVPYRLTCAVVCDEASSAVTSIVSLAASALSDVTTALGFAASAGVDLTSAQDAVAAPSAAVKATASYSSALNALAGAGKLIGANITAAESALGATTWATANQPPSTAYILSDLVYVTQQMSSLSIAQSYLGRASLNLANAST